MPILPDRAPNRSSQPAAAAVWGQRLPVDPTPSRDGGSYRAPPRHPSVLPRVTICRMHNVAATVATVPAGLLRHTFPMIAPFQNWGRPKFLTTFPTSRGYGITVP